MGRKTTTYYQDMSNTWLDMVNSNLGHQVTGSATNKGDHRCLFGLANVKYAVWWLVTNIHPLEGIKKRHKTALDNCHDS